MVQENCYSLTAALWAGRPIKLFCKGPDSAFIEVNGSLCLGFSGLFSRSRWKRGKQCWIKGDVKTALFFFWDALKSYENSQIYHLQLIKLSQRLQKLSFLAREIKCPSSSTMFTAFWGQPYSSPTSCQCPPACLAEVWVSPSPPTALCERCGCVERHPGNPISAYADQRAPRCASQQKTPPATQITQRMHWGQPKAAVLPGKRPTMELATRASCCYRERGPLTALSHAHVPRADPSPPPIHLQCLWPTCGPHLCYISWGTSIHMCNHIYVLCTASTRTLQWSLP